MSEKFFFVCVWCMKNSFECLLESKPHGSCGFNCSCVKLKKIQGGVHYNIHSVILININKKKKKTEQKNPLLEYKPHTGLILV